MQLKDKVIKNMITEKIVKYKKLEKILDDEWLPLLDYMESYFISDDKFEIQFYFPEPNSLKLDIDNVQLFFNQVDITNDWRDESFNSLHFMLPRNKILVGKYITVIKYFKK